MFLMDLGGKVLVNSGMVPFPWRWKIGPWMISFVSNMIVFHFHDDGRRSK